MLAVILGLLAAPAVAQDMHILALGDSLTQGYGLPAEQGFVPQLEAWLKARGHHVTIINGGVSGDTTRGGLARVDWSLTDEVNAMIVTLGGNDVLRGLDPADTRENLAGILDAGQAKGVEMLVIGLSAATNYGREYKAEFDAIYPDLAHEYGALYEPDFFAGLMGQDNNPAAALEYMQPDGIHPKSQGVARIVERIGPKVEDLIGRAKAK